MQIALVYDRVNKWGGAERLLLSLHKIFPEAPLFTLVSNPQTAPWSREFPKVIPSAINNIPFFRTRHEILAPVSQLFFEQFNFDDFDLVISVSSEHAKAIITRPQTLHIDYCLTPPRYLWDKPQIPEPFLSYFRRADIVSASRPDKYIAISDEVKKRIFSNYGYSSTVIYPPVDDKFLHSKIVNSANRSRYLVVSRLVGYKQLDVVVDAFRELQLPLDIVGTGRRFSHLQRKSTPNIRFVGQVGDDELIKSYTHAKALIFPQKEDFGLTPLEAQACGTPVVAYRDGGALETIVDEKTGIFFSKQTPDSLKEAIIQFESLAPFSPTDCRTQAEKFSESRFHQQFRATVEAIWQRHLRTLS